METGKKAAVVVVLVIVIVGAVVWIAKAGRRSTTMPEAMRKEMITRVDEETLEAISLTREEWRELAEPVPAVVEEGADPRQVRRVPRWKNPKTGQYTVVPAIQCASCGADLPGTMFPIGFGTCPKCGNPITRPPE